MEIRNEILKNLVPEDFFFYGEPIFHPKEDYSKVIDKIKSLSSKEKNIMSVYTFGEITCPGISDIDLIFVLKNTTKLPKFLRSPPKDKTFDYIICHPFFIVNEKIMQNMNYIYPISNFELIYGKKINIKELSKKEYKQSLIFLTTDVILRHFPGDYLNILLSKRINLRMCLLRLNALNYSISIFKKLNGKAKKEWGIFSNDIFNLRNSWFKIISEKRKNMVIELLKRAVYISYDFLIEFKKIFLSAKIDNMSLKFKRDVLFKGTKERLSFIKNVDVESSIDSIIMHLKKYGNFYSILPMVFLSQLCAYASLNGPLSSYIRKRLSVKCRLRDINEVLGNRVKLLNEQVNITIQLKHSHYPCFFPLGYKNTSGLKNKLRYLAILVINNSFFRKIIYPLREKMKLF